ncbi:MAG TPA: hypothetical protein VGR71_02460, partial [Nitrospira sp.]|nr:hypothetical protein [Nitrospira sp.]
MAKKMPMREIATKNSRRDRRGRKVNRGDRVRIVGVPKGLRDDERMQTKTIFERSRGRIFRVVGFYSDGIHDDLIELHVGKVVGGPGYKHSIFVEPRLVEVVE